MGQDRRHMWRALELARRGRPYVAPNPMCGALVVDSEGRTVGEGFHEKIGEPHAEVNALRNAGEGARGGTLYVTLEPCCNTWEGKKTPPCLPAILSAGVARVVIAIEDPHPKVRGRCVKELTAAGVQVSVGECKAEARDLNGAYFSLTERARPLLTAKWAMTLDGKIATRTGDARWISSEQSRREVHVDRACSGAVIVGSGTVIRDDPLLKAQTDIGRQPARVIIDTELKTPLDSRLVKSAGDSQVLIYCADDADEKTQKALEDAGVCLILLPRHGKKHLRWIEICHDLGQRGVSSAFIEGGGGLLASAFKARAVDRVKVFIAPKIFGGEEATTPVEGPGVPDVARAVSFTNLRTRTVGTDVVIEGHCVYPTDDGPSESGFWEGYGSADSSES